MSQPLSTTEDDCSVMNRKATLDDLSGIAKVHINIWSSTYKEEAMVGENYQLY